MSDIETKIILPLTPAFAARVERALRKRYRLKQPAFEATKEADAALQELQIMIAQALGKCEVGSDG